MCSVGTINGMRGKKERQETGDKYVRGGKAVCRLPLFSLSLCVLLAGLYYMLSERLVVTGKQATFLLVRWKRRSRFGAFLFHPILRISRCPPLSLSLSPACT